MIENICSEQMDAFIANHYYIPFIISAIAFILAVFVAKAFNRQFLTGDKIVKFRNKDIIKVVLEKFRIVTLPLFTLIFLSAGSILSHKIAGNHDVLTVLMTFTIIWFILAFLWALTLNKNLTTLVAVLFISGAVLNIFGVLTPTVTLLDAWSIQLASYKISVYQILKGAMILFVLLLLTRKASEFGQRYIHKLHTVNINTRELLAKLFQATLYFIALLFILDLMGVSLTSLTIFSGAVVVGVGFGTQKIASNIISGLMLLFEKTIEIGDIVEMKDGTWCWVRHLGARAAMLEALDGREIIMPNDELISQPVTNLTFSHAKLRLELKIRVPYHADLEVVRRLIWEAALNAPLCSKTTPPDCFLFEFGENGAVFLVHVWVDDVTRGRYRSQSEALFAIWRKLKENGIEIPYQQYDIAFKNSPVQPVSQPQEQPQAAPTPKEAT